MKNSIKTIILIAVSALVLVAVVLGILGVVDVYTMAEVKTNLLNSLYIIAIITAGLSLISVITSVFRK